MSDIPTKVREIVKARSKGRCEICGVAASSMHMSHRTGRQMGGADRPWLHSPANLLHVHHSCHLNRIEKQRSDAYMRGWLVLAGVDPSSVPAQLWDGWYLLDHEGGFVSCEGPGYGEVLHSP